MSITLAAVAIQQVTLAQQLLLGQLGLIRTVAVKDLGGSIRGAYIGSKIIYADTISPSPVILIFSKPPGQYLIQINI